MSPAVRTLVLTQLLVVLVGSAWAVQPPSRVRSAEPLTVAASAPEVVTAAVARPAPRRPVHRAAKPVPAKRKHVVRHPHRRPQPRPVARPHVRRTAVATKVVTGSTAQQRMEQAVARIPGYTKGSATWVLVAKDGYWGTADWYNSVIYISPAVPARRIYDVVAHEWSHLLSVKGYDTIRQANDAMNAYFGGSGFTGAERAADCMARLLGASWTHYTSCTDAHWRAGAAELLARHRV